MTTPRVSVCIVTYNHEHYIYNSIMSVLAQAHNIPLEILVGDDQSNDRTEETVRKLATQFPDIIRYFRHETRLGPSGNYQFLIGQSRGEYIAHLDGDDYWLPGKLMRQVSLMDEVDRISSSYTNAFCISDSGESAGIFNNPQPNEIDMTYLLEKGNFLNHSSILYRAELGSSILLWESDFIDYKIHLYLASQGNLGYVNSPGVVYRASSNTSMIVHQGDHVRELYWRAISEVSTKDKMSSNCRLSASADFLRRIFFKSVRLRSFKLLRKWWPIVSAANEHHKNRLVLLTTWSILVMGYREIMSHIAARLGGTRLRVIYWR